MAAKPLVAVVDDSLPMRLLAKKTLAANGFQTQEAENGLQGLKLVQKLVKGGSEVSLVLLDLNMPQMGGTECLAKLREDEATKDVPVIVVTSQNDRESIMSCARHGLQGYMLKPYTTERLLAEVRKVVYKDSGASEKESSASLQSIDEAMKANLLDRLEEAVRVTAESGECEMKEEGACPVARRMREILEALEAH
jgi:CheY-like chemotaxis protein